VCWINNVCLTGKSNSKPWHFRVFCHRITRFISFKSIC